METMDKTTLTELQQTMRAFTIRMISSTVVRKNYTVSFKPRRK
jgi:hypothetical protein